MVATGDGVSNTAKVLGIAEFNQGFATKLIGYEPANQANSTKRSPADRLRTAYDHFLDDDGNAIAGTKLDRWLHAPQPKTEAPTPTPSPQLDYGMNRIVFGNPLVVAPAPSEASSQDDLRLMADQLAIRQQLAETPLKLDGGRIAEIDATAFMLAVFGTQPRDPADLKTLESELSTQIDLSRDSEVGQHNRAAFGLAS